VQALLAASQAPADCAAARLLVLETEPEHFEGLGSVLIAFAEGLAEAQAAGRALVVGPARRAEPAVFRLANLTWTSFFQPLGACSWEEHVTRAEAARLVRRRHSFSPLAHLPACQ